MSKRTKDRWVETHFKLSNGTLLKIYHNLPNQIEMAFQNWLARTKTFTEKSFCNYINDKRERGMTDHTAYTEEEYLNLTINDLQIK